MPFARLWAPAILVLLLAPVAFAQQPATFSVNGVNGPLTPGTSATLSATLSIPCSLLPKGSASNGAIVLSAGPRWLTMPSPATFVAGPCGDDPQVVHTQILLQVSNDAPAFMGEPATFLASVAGSNLTAQITVIADYFPKLALTTPEATKQGSPQTVLTFPLHIKNKGNGITRVTLEVGAVPTGWVVLKPQSVTLQADQNGGLITDGTVNVIVQTPHRFGFLNGEVTIPVYVNATAAAGGSSLVDSQVVNFTAQVKGFDTPGPGVGILALAIVACALIARRWRA